MTKKYLLSVALLEASIARDWAHRCQQLLVSQKRDKKNLRTARIAYFARAKYFIKRAREIKRDDFSNVPNELRPK